MRCNNSKSLAGRILPATLLSLWIPAAAGAQIQPGPPVLESYFVKPLQLIDLPTASILRGGQMRSALRLYEQGGLMARLSVGISNRMMFGVSYAAQHVIGGEEVDWHPAPGVHLAYRLVEEDLNLPALVLGFDSQGFGPLRLDETGVIQGYTYKSRGFYVVASKNYASVLDIGLHAGANYSLEKADRDPNIFMGTDLAVSRDFGFQVEYDFTINDDEDRVHSSGKGYLNAGVRWAFASNIYLEFDFKNLLAETSGEGGLRRILKVVYHGSVL